MWFISIVSCNVPLVDHPVVNFSILALPYESLILLRYFQVWKIVVYNAIYDIIILVLVGFSDQRQLVAFHWSLSNSKFLQACIWH